MCVLFVQKVLVCDVCYLCRKCWCVMCVLFVQKVLVCNVCAICAESVGV